MNWIDTNIEKAPEMAVSQGEFADIFIALRNRNAGCASTMTFDEKAAKHIPGMELLT
ncbi:MULTISPECIES: hypothetical protein [unclassified Sinorhizobium]|uniref:hypothetical protein n=1 Tax=unclassified Sinorhizobium TaxID=2613772 RepID=UPI0035231886